MWTEQIDEILGGDQVVALGYTTPASGVVLTPVTNFGLRDRDRGTLSAFNSSVGVYRKLARIRQSPKIAVAYHTRQLSFANRPEYVLVQGRASLSAPTPDYPRSVREAWEQFGGPVDVGAAWDRWLRAYNLRVEIRIAIERIVVWPDLWCSGAPQVVGSAIPGAPAPQSAPKNGAGPRVDHRRAGGRLSRLPHRLLAWVDANGYPLIVPVDVAAVAQDGIVLDVPAGNVPAGGRRAGALAHWFARYTAGQDQRRHTGWMQATSDRQVLYAPHTASGYRMPASMVVYRIAAGAGTRRGLRGARQAGFGG